MKASPFTDVVDVTPIPAKKRGAKGPRSRPFRDVVQSLLDDNAENVSLWLRQIADGSQPVLDQSGRVIFPGRPADPSTALLRLTQLAEFVAPKLGRTELLGADAGPLTVVVQKLT